MLYYLFKLNPSELIMNNCRCVCFWLIIQFLPFGYGARGTFGRPDDDKFQMLIAGGIIPENAKYVRNLVSIRTLNYIEMQGDNHFCTGIIVSSKTILTAAHCVTDSHKSVMHPRGLLIVFGSVYRLERYGKHDTRRVERIVTHPRYHRYVNYDVALLKLTSRIPSNLRNVKPIIKRKRLIVSPGMQCVTLGWGQVYPHGPYANEIMYLDVIVRDPDYCSELTYFTKEGTICVQPDEEGELCPGDLGGPLMCQDSLAGIIGGSKGCQGKKSMKFMNFTHFESWVESTVLSLSGNRNLFSISLLIMCQLHWV